MRKNSFVLAVAGLLSILFFSSCKNNIGDCIHTAHSEGGVIVEVVDISEICMDPNNHSGGNFKILESGAYVGIKSMALLENPSCDTAAFPAIDFDNFSLLGQHAEAEGDGTTFYREVTMDTVAQTVTYTIYVRACGKAKQFVNSLNWVKVPKIPNGYVVNFEKVNE